MEGYGIKTSNTMRIVFLLFAIMGYQVLFSQNVEENRVSVCGFFYEAFDKEEITDYYMNQYKRHIAESAYSIAIDLRNTTNLILTEIDGRELYEKRQYGMLWDCVSEMNSDTVFIYPNLSDMTLYKRCGFESLSLGKCDYIKKCALKSSPFYAPYNSNKLFRCFYFKGTASIKNVDKMNKEWASYILDSYAIGNLKNKKYVLIIDNIQTYTPYVLLEYLPVWLPLNQGIGTLGNPQD